MVVAKNALSKFLTHLQMLRANIVKLKVEWDATQDNNLSEGAHPKGALTRGALKVSEMLKNKTFELLMTLKVLEFEEFQISKKVDVQNNVYDTFEKRAAQGEAEYILKCLSRLVERFWDYKTQ